MLSFFRFKVILLHDLGNAKVNEFGVSVTQYDKSVVIFIFLPRSTANDTSVRFHSFRYKSAMLLTVKLNLELFDRLFYYFVGTE